MTDGVLSLLLGVGLTLPSRLGGTRKLDSLVANTLFVPTLELRTKTGPYLRTYVSQTNPRTGMNDSRHY